MNNLSLSCRVLALFAIFSRTMLFNPNILKFDDGRIEAPRSKLLSSSNCIQDTARDELGTVPKVYLLWSMWEGVAPGGNCIDILQEKAQKASIYLILTDYGRPAV